MQNTKSRGRESSDIDFETVAVDTTELIWQW